METSAFTESKVTNYMKLYYMKGIPQICSKFNETLYALFIYLFIYLFFIYFFILYLFILEVSTFTSCINMYNISSLKA